MQIHPLLLVAFAITIGSFGCERRTVVVETRPAEPVAEPIARTETLETTKLASALDTFERNPTAENSAEVKEAFANLEGEIAELEARVVKTSGGDRDEAALKLRNLQSYRDAERLRFTKAQALSGVDATASPDLPPRRDGEAVKDGARKAGESLEDAAKKTGSIVKDVAEKAGDALKDAVR